MDSKTKALNRLANMGFGAPAAAAAGAGADVKANGTSGGAASWFGHVKAAPLDPILGTNILFNKDQDKRKINLGIGAYRTDEGKPLVLNSVKKAEKLALMDPTRNMEYLPQNGLAKYVELARGLLFGAKNPAIPRIASVQSLSGTGSLRLGMAFINSFLPKSTVYYSNPTWGTHQSILAHSRVPGKAYRYWDAKGKKLDLKGLLEDLSAAPQGSVILLHACAHNPTGVDPTQDEWKQIAAVMKEKGLLPYFDSAYQGFASGDPDRDAWAIRYFVEQGFEMIVSQSFAKNFGLYGERIGALHVVSGASVGAAQNETIISQLNLLIRNLYSNPPKHGAEIVALVLSNPELNAEWRQELKDMSGRIIAMRELLVQHLTKLQTPGDWSHITSQIGMFSFTGLSAPQCESLIKKHHVYLLTSGRISMAGINSKNVEYLAAAIDDVVRNVKA